MYRKQGRAECADRQSAGERVPRSYFDGCNSSEPIQPSKWRALQALDQSEMERVMEAFR